MVVYGFDDVKNKKPVVRHEDTGWVAIAYGSVSGTLFQRYMNGVIWLRANEFEHAITPLSGNQGILTHIGNVSTPYIPEVEMRISIPVFAPNTVINVADATLIINTSGEIWIRSVNFEPGLIENQTLLTTFCASYPDTEE